MKDRPYQWHTSHNLLMMLGKVQDEKDKESIATTKAIQDELEYRTTARRKQMIKHNERMLS